MYSLYDPCARERTLPLCVLFGGKVLSGFDHHLGPSDSFHILVV